jgi:hypothetical protein
MGYPSKMIAVPCVAAYAASPVCVVMILFSSLSVTDPLNHGELNSGQHNCHM